jgi:ABC-type antimicrobial peptide transport system permease subunit
LARIHPGNEAEAGRQMGIILNNLLRRKTRTFLTVLGVAIGVASVVSMSAMAEGFINSYTTMFSSSGADIIVAQKDAGDILFSAVDDNVGPQLSGMIGVDKISGVTVNMVTTPDVPYFIIFGLDPTEFGLAHYRVVEGGAIRGPRQMLLGRTAARSFNKRVGDNFKFLEVSFRVVGLYETGQAVEEWGAVISLKESQEVFKKPRQVAYYQVKVRQPEFVPLLMADVVRRFPKLTASRSASYMDDQAETGMFRAMGWFIGILAAIAGGLIMMNTMVMSVYERTREIGVLRALGWRRGRVLMMILGEAFVLSIVGGVAGILLGIGLIQVLTQIPAVASFLTATFTVEMFAQAMIVALLLGATGGLYPAWKAAQLQPVEAMRYEGGGAARSKPDANVGSVGYRNNWLRQLRSVAMHNLPRQRTRTILTVAGIGMGIAFVVAMGGMADGFVAQYTAMGGQAGDLTVTEAKASDMTMASIDDKVGRWITMLPDVESVSGMLIGFTQVPGASYLIILGLDPASYAMRHFAITQGDPLRLPKDIMLGKLAAENMKKRVGDTVRLMGGAYRVAGIYETGISYEDAGGVISLSEAQNALKKPAQVSVYGIKLKDDSKAELVRQQVEARWPQVSVSRSTEFAEKGNDIQSTRTIVSALTFIAMLVGGVGTMNTMLMSVSERTREIGTLRALGWRRRRVVGMIVRESLVLSFLSGLVGVAAGMGMGMLAAAEPTLGSFLTPSYSPQLMLQAMGLALLLGGVGALYPAWRASNLSPIEALRYE